MFEGASNLAEGVDKAFIFIFTIAFIFIVGITVFMIFTVIHFSRKKGKPAKQFTGSIKLEILWTVVPLILVMMMFYYGWVGFAPMRKVPADAMNVTAIGRMWEWEFDQSDTRDMDFKITPTNVIKTPTMFMDPDKTTFNYVDTGNLQILELPYKGNKISMLILLPKQGEDYDLETGEIITFNYTLEDLELSSEKLNEYKNQMQETKLDAIYFPKFEFDTKYSMKETLSSLGMSAAFSDTEADFSGMTGKRDLFITSVIHQAYVKVDEKGTEAAAATGVIMGGTSAGPSNVFQADHPFIFIIQEKETGNILFLGKVVDPTK